VGAAPERTGAGAEGAEAGEERSRTRISLLIPYWKMSQRLVLLYI
jgi:hypothetical protein